MISTAQLKQIIADLIEEPSNFIEVNRNAMQLMVDSIGFRQTKANPNRWTAHNKSLLKKNGRVYLHDFDTDLTYFTE